MSSLTREELNEVMDLVRDVTNSPLALLEKAVETIGTSVPEGDEATVAVFVLCAAAIVDSLLRVRDSLDSMPVGTQA